MFLRHPCNTHFYLSETLHSQASLLKNKNNYNEWFNLCITHYSQFCFLSVSFPPPILSLRYLLRPQRTYLENVSNSQKKIPVISVPWDFVDVAKCHCFQTYTNVLTRRSVRLKMTSVRLHFRGVPCWWRSPIRAGSHSSDVLLLGILLLLWDSLFKMLKFSLLSKIMQLWIDKLQKYINQWFY